MKKKIKITHIPYTKNNTINITDKKYKRWYKNCKQQRKRKAKICQCCPFRKEIEKQEVLYDK